jgi:hypothetical protein
MGHRNRSDARGVATSSRQAALIGGAHIWENDHEPDLASVLADPIVGLVMTRDGLSPDDVAGVIRQTRDRLLAARVS